MAEKKGRPTPKRSEVRASKKKPLVAPKGREAQRAQRRSDASVRATARAALKTGDERNYPPVAAGPERALVRDVIDSRRSFAWVAIPGYVVGLVLSFVPSRATRGAASVLFLLLVGVFVADTYLAGREVRRALTRRFPDGTKEPLKRLGRYGMVRNTQFRRSRLPPPRVSRGDAV